MEEELAWMFEEEDTLTITEAQPLHSQSTHIESTYSQVSQVSQPQSSSQTQAQGSEGVYLQRHFKNDYVSIVRAALAALQEDKMLRMKSSVHGAGVLGQCDALLRDYGAFHRVATGVYDSVGKGIWACIASARSPKPRIRAASAAANFHRVITQSDSARPIHCALKGAISSAGVLDIRDSATFIVFSASLCRRIFDQTLLVKVASMTTSLLIEIDEDLVAAESRAEVVVYVLGYTLAQIRLGTVRWRTEKWVAYASFLPSLYTTDPGQSGLDDEALAWIRERSKGGLLVPKSDLANFFIALETQLCSSTAQATADIFWDSLHPQLATLVPTIIGRSEHGGESESNKWMGDFLTLLIRIYRRIYTRGLARRLSNFAAETPETGAGKVPLRQDLQSPHISPDSMDTATDS